MKYSEYASYDAVGLAELARRREVTHEELIECACSRLDEVNPRINAVVHRFEQRPPADPTSPSLRRPLDGVPFLVKDLDGVLAGAPLTMGCRALSNHVAPSDCEIVARYRRAGVIFIGGTNSPELGLMPTTEPELHGPTRNPWNIAYSAGGSSGGAAAAVAAGIVPAAHGSDGGGSIRIPASACGLFGLKPSRGRMPLGLGGIEDWGGLAVPHVISRSVRDSAAFLDIACGPNSDGPPAVPGPRGPYVQQLGRGPEKLRAGVVKNSILGKHTHPDCMKALDDAAKLLSSLGHEVEETLLPISPPQVSLHFMTIVTACTAAVVDQIAALAGHPPCRRFFEAETLFLWQLGHAISAAEYEQARAGMAETTQTMARFMERYDVLLTPTLTYPPSKIGELGLTPVERAGLALLRVVRPKPLLKRVLHALSQDLVEKTSNTMLFNMTGQPAMSVPLFWNSEGLPIGAQFAGRYGDEATLLRLASQLEQERPWFNRRPSL